MTPEESQLHSLSAGLDLIHKAMQPKRPDPPTLADELRSRCLNRSGCQVDGNPNACPLCRAAAALEALDADNKRLRKWLVCIGEYGQDDLARRVSDALGDVTPPWSISELKAKHESALSARPPASKES